MKVGLFGLGIVGGHLLDYFQRLNTNGVSLDKIIVRDTSKQRVITRNDGSSSELKFENISDDPSYILSDDSIDVVLDATNSQDDTLIKEALQRGKSVVTANKKVIALYGNDLFRVADDNNQVLRIEASVAGEVPIIQTLSDYHFHGGITSIEGIVNGTCNYVLTRMAQGGASFDDALKEAQDKGFAEADPTMDVEGFDSVYKLAILASVGFGMPLCEKRIVDQIYRRGIENTTSSIQRFVSRFGGGNSLKLVATGIRDDDKVHLRVTPTIVSNDSQLGQTLYEDNCVKVTKSFGGVSYHKGKGAGGEPTAAAMISDLKMVKYIRDTNSKPSHYGEFYKNDNAVVLPIEPQELRVAIESWSPERQVGVFLNKVKSLSAQGLDIEQIYNHSGLQGDVTPDFFVLRPACYRNIKQAADNIKGLDCVDGFIRMYPINHNKIFD